MTKIHETGPAADAAFYLSAHLAGAENTEVELMFISRKRHQDSPVFYLLVEKTTDGREHSHVIFTTDYPSRDEAVEATMKIWTRMLRIHGFIEN